MKRPDLLRDDRDQTNDGSILPSYFSHLFLNVIPDNSKLPRWKIFGNTIIAELPLQPFSLRERVYRSIVLLRQLNITTLMYGHGAPCPDGRGKPSPYH